MRKISIITSGIFIAISVFIILMARTFPEGSNGVVGPGFFPIILACIVILLSCIQIYNSTVRPSQEERENKVNLLSNQSIRVWISMGITVAYFVLMYLVGFMISTPIFLFVALLYFKVKSWPVRILVPILTTAAVYVIFTVLLYVQLPAGELF